MKHSRKHLSGITLMIQGSFAFSIMALCVKVASQTLPSLEIVFFRSLIGTIMIVGVIIQKKASFLGHERMLLSLRGLSGFIALSLFFYTLGRLPLATAVILNYTAPIFSALFAVWFLKEKTSPFLFVMTIVSFAGVYLLAGVKFENWHAAIFLGLLSAIFAAAAYVLIRALKHRESPLTIILYFTGISTIGSFFYLPFGFVWPDAAGWLALAGVGIFSFYGQLWMTIALRRAPASLVSPFGYVTPLLTFFYGLFFWQEMLTPASLLGAFLIILGGVLISLFGTRRPEISKEV